MLSCHEVFSSIFWGLSTIYVAGGFILLDGETFEAVGKWQKENNSTKFGYDFWYQPRHNVMISSEWGAPKAFMKGFDLEDFKAGELCFLDTSYIFLYPNHY